jgi:hypothetical protein
LPEPALVLSAPANASYVASVPFPAKWVLEFNTPVTLRTSENNMSSEILVADTANKTVVVPMGLIQGHGTNKLVIDVLSYPIGGAGGVSKTDGSELTITIPPNSVWAAGNASLQNGAWLKTSFSYDVSMPVLVDTDMPGYGATRFITRSPQQITLVYSEPLALASRVFTMSTGISLVSTHDGTILTIGANMLTVPEDKPDTVIINCRDPAFRGMDWANRDPHNYLLMLSTGVVVDAAGLQSPLARLNITSIDTSLLQLELAILLPASVIPNEFRDELSKLIEKVTRVPFARRFSIDRIEFQSPAQFNEQQDGQRER